MHQAPAVGVGQTMCRLADDRRGLLHAQWPPRTHQSAQIGPWNILGHKKIDVSIVASVIGSDQIRVIQLSLRANLARKIGNRLWRRAAVGEYLDRHLAAHHLMHGLEYLAHSPLGDPVGN